MKVVEPQVYVPLEEISPGKILRLERYGRVCYKSEGLAAEGRAGEFIRTLIKSGHESVIEHEKATVLMVVDRGVSHELVRHRVGSYSQESTRYCNYARDRFGGEITVIRPFFYAGREEHLRAWEKACRQAEEAYFKLLEDGQPQEARAVLPTSLKTEVVVTYNFREWRHFFRLRCAANAHPQIRQVAIPLLMEFRRQLPPLFEDIAWDGGFPAEHYARVIRSDGFFRPLPEE